MKRFLLFLLLLIFATRSHAGTELQWGKALRVPTTALTVTVPNCTSDGSAVLTTTGDFRSSGVIPGMNIITGGTLAIPATAVVLSFSKTSLVMSQAAGTGTGTATFTTLPRVAPLNIPIMGGINPTDTTGVPFQFDAFGNLYAVDPNRDRDFSTFVNLFSSASVPTNGTYQMNSPKYIGQFSRAALMFNYSGAAAADSDSVIMVIRVYGRTSLNSGNRYLWTPLTKVTSNDTCQCNTPAADSAGAATKCIVPPASFVVGRNIQNGFGVAGGWKAAAFFTGGGGTTTTRANMRKIPAYAWRQGGANGVMIPLTDDAGNPCPFPYIEVEVGNLSWARAFTVSCDVWPRVN